MAKFHALCQAIEKVLIIIVAVFAAVMIIVTSIEVFRRYLFPVLPVVRGISPVFDGQCSLFWRRGGLPAQKSDTPGFGNQPDARQGKALPGNGLGNYQLLYFTCLSVLFYKSSNESGSIQANQHWLPHFHGYCLCYHAH